MEALARQTESKSAVLLNGVALAPPSAPQRIKAAISAANQIIGRPYIWGGGHASWYSRGYDCSGAVSYALAGGGFLQTPLDSSRLMHWGAPGPRPLAHGLRQLRPHLRGDRRDALGHGRRRPRLRAPLAPGAPLPGRLRRPPPAGVLRRPK